VSFLSKPLLDIVVEDRSFSTLSVKADALLWKREGVPSDISTWKLAIFLIAGVLSRRTEPVEPEDGLSKSSDCPNLHSRSQLVKGMLSKNLDGYEQSGQKYARFDPSEEIKR